LDDYHGNITIGDIKMYFGDMSDDEIAEVFDIIKLYTIDYNEKLRRWYVKSDLRIKVKTPLISIPNGEFWKRWIKSEENTRLGDTYIKMRETFVSRMRSIHNYYLSSWNIFKMPNDDYNYQRISQDSDNWSYSSMNNLAVGGFSGEILSFVSIHVMFIE
jgi:hypothetical protein